MKELLPALRINEGAYSIKKIDLHLSKSANLNFINDIHYSEEYNLSFDSVTKKYEYMPYKYTSVVDPESGTTLIGLPDRNNSKVVRLVPSNTTVIDKLS